MARIRRKPNGSYQVLTRDGFGRRSTERSVGVFERKADALRAKAKAEVDTASGLFVDPTLGRQSLVDMMRAHVGRQSYRSNTQRNADHAIGHVRRWFGDRPIASVRPSDVQAFVVSLELGPRTVATVFQYLRATLIAAVHDGIIARDPSARTKLPRLAEEQITVPTDDVLALYAKSPPGFAAAIVLGAGLGLRSGEVCGLTADRIDWLKQTVRIDRQWHGREDRFSVTKSSAAMRSIPANADVLAELSAHVDTYGTGEHAVLLHAAGRPLNANRFQHRFDQTAATAGLAVTSHDLRHHYASTLLAAGVLDRGRPARPGAREAVHHPRLRAPHGRRRGATSGRWGQDLCSAGGPGADLRGSA